MIHFYGHINYNDLTATTGMMMVNRVNRGKYLKTETVFFQTMSEL